MMKRTTVDGHYRRLRQVESVGLFACPPVVLPCCVSTIGFLSSRDTASVSPCFPLSLVRRNIPLPSSTLQPDSRQRSANSETNSLNIIRMEQIFHCIFKFVIFESFSVIRFENSQLYINKYCSIPSCPSPQISSGDLLLLT